jgi:hypothetical protein
MAMLPGTPIIGVSVAKPISAAMRRCPITAFCHG